MASLGHPPTDPRGSRFDGFAYVVVVLVQPRWRAQSEMADGMLPAAAPVAGKRHPVTAAMYELDRRCRILRRWIEQPRAFRSRWFSASRQHAAARVERKMIKLGAVACRTGEHQTFPGPRQPPVALVIWKVRPMLGLSFRAKVLDWIGSALDQDLAVAALPRLRFVERLARFLGVVPVAELVRDTASSRVANAPQLLGTDLREGSGRRAAADADQLGLLSSRRT